LILAEEIFYRQQLDRNVISVNTLIKAYIIHQRFDHAVQLAQRLNTNERNAGTYVLWANAIAYLNDTNMADRIHTELRSLPLSTQHTWNQDCRLINALIHVINTRTV
jgi:hypothetical protein